MNDPILEVLINGTQTAVDAHQITLNQAEELRMEMHYAAAMSVEIETEQRISEVMGNAG